MQTVDVKQHGTIHTMTNTEEFLEAGKWAVVGAIAGSMLGYIGDTLGYAGNPLVEGFVRLVAGAGDSIAELSLLLVSRLKGVRLGIKSYILGKALGMLLGPMLHSLVRISGFNPYGIAGTVYAIAYSNMDNMMGSLAYLFTQVRQERSFRRGWQIFRHEPYQVGNMLAIGAIGTTDLFVRIIGFSPLANIAAGLEAGIMDTDSLLAWLWAKRFSTKRKKD